MSLLDNRQVIKWCFGPITEVSLINTSDEKKLAGPKKLEDGWGNSITGKAGGQWTTKLCQDLVMEALMKMGKKNVRRAEPHKGTIRNKRYQPDLECDEYVYEVKGRNWTTPGTAGEKILGVPLKYGEVPTIYKKPLQIVLVGYQEYEAENDFAFGDLLDPNTQTAELKGSLAYFSEHKISYVGLTHMLKLLKFHP